ncbi:MAG: lytic transglycosylase domain-containing protein [Candidatus Acidiferrales bacterium]
MTFQIRRMGAAVVLASIFFISISAYAQTPAAAKRAGLPPEAQLEAWSRALKDKQPAAAYASLSVFASRKRSGELGQRAALALGYFDYSKGNYAKARTWLDKASGDLLLGDYVLYWSAETDRGLYRFVPAMDELKKLRHDYPDSVMTEQALEALGDIALGASQPQEILDALAAYPGTETDPALLFVRAQAHESANDLTGAASDYLAVFYRYPQSIQSHEAGMKAELLHGKLGASFPSVPLDVRMAHADGLYTTHEWYEARDDYLQLLPDLAGAGRDRAMVRIAQCRVGLGEPLSALTELSVSDPDADAERLELLSQAYRNLQSEAPMLAATEAAVARAPSSRWAEQALYFAGNYYWVQLDRERAASYYARVDHDFSGSTDAPAANWRVAWTAYLDHNPEAVSLLEQHLARFPNSQFITDDLYWLGREAEKSGDVPRARAYYGKICDRFTQTYFGGLAAARLAALGDGPVTLIDALARILPPPPAMSIAATIPPEAAPRQARADALRSIAFDSSAELELRAAYATTGEPRLLLEAAQAAAKAGHYGPSMTTARQLCPGLEARRFEDVPLEVWLVAFPLPYEKPLRAAAAHAAVDPMLVAGLIRQESAFETNAVSHANAYGLMQLLPKTARLLARQTRVGYSHVRLFDPEYNLRLGTVYLANLHKTWGSFEAALAAYNAGEDRVGTWQAGRAFAEPAEFVDSIPFTETREYVQIVLRNAEVYRRLYGNSVPAAHPRAARRARVSAR